MDWVHLAQCSERDNEPSDSIRAVTIPLTRATPNPSTTTPLSVSSSLSCRRLV